VFPAALERAATETSGQNAALAAQGTTLFSLFVALVPDTFLAHLIKNA
jgi:hypothetical protein